MSVNWHRKSSLRRISLQLLFVLGVSILAYDYWAEQGAESAYFVLLGGGLFLTLLVAVPVLGRTFSNRD